MNIDKENTTIVDGAGQQADIDARVEQIRREVENSSLITTRKNCKSAWPSWPAVLL